MINGWKTCLDADELSFSFGYKTHNFKILNGGRLYSRIHLVNQKFTDIGKSREIVYIAISNIKPFLAG